jgi:predicted component of type VI protein secretion system
MTVMLAMITPQAWTGRLVPVSCSPFVIGREPGCHLRAHTPAVAARHCELLVRADRIFVRDLAGSLTTCVNGRPVKDEQELRDQDCVRVGRLEFTIRLPCGSAQPHAEPSPPAEAEEAAATLLLALDAAETLGGSAPSAAAETLPLADGSKTLPPREPKRVANPGRPELGDTALAAAQLLARIRKFRGPGKGKSEIAARS